MSNDTVKIVLMGAPMGKERVRIRVIGGHGQAYTPERTVNYESRLAAEAQRVMADRPLLDGPLEVAVLIRMLVPKSKAKKWREAALAGDIFPTSKPDADNCAKMLDAFNLIVWTDDSQIVSLRVDKIYHEKPAFIATVRPKRSKGVFA
jgi:Holliday junction resolvase RusA-like endonuclease